MKPAIQTTRGLPFGLGTLCLLITGCGTETVAVADLKVERTDLTVSSGEISLRGSLLLPEGTHRVPCVVLTHGSDPAIRQQYRHLADFFLAKGIAAFTYDKRGCGESTGTYVEAPDLTIPAQDLIACVERVRKHPRVDASRLGVWGISQGGWVAPLAASRSKAIRFVIMISGPSISPMQQNLFDKANQLRAAGVDEPTVEKITGLRKLVWTYLATGKGQAEASAAWAEAKTQPWFKHLQNEAPMGNRDLILKHPRMVQFAPHARYDPEPALRKLSVPVLAIYGSADTIVPAARCERLMKQFFAGDRRRLLTTRIFKEADHGIRMTHNNGERRFAPGYWELVTKWTSER